MRVNGFADHKSNLIGRRDSYAPLSGGPLPFARNCLRGAYAKISRALGAINEAIKLLFLRSFLLLPTDKILLTQAFGGQRSIQLSYGCGVIHLADWLLRGNGCKGFCRLQWRPRGPLSGGGHPFESYHLESIVGRARLIHSATSPEVRE